MQDTLTMSKLIIVDADPEVRQQLRWAMREDLPVIETDSLETTLACLEAEHNPFICLDMGHKSALEKGMEIIDAVLSLHRNAKIIAITENHEDGTAKEAVRRGAFDYLIKPIDAQSLRSVLERAKRISALEEDVQTSPSWVPVGPEWPMIGDSEAMKNVFSLIRRLSEIEVSVLITGEPGTGQETCARALHMHGRRHGNAFIQVNCGAMPESQLDAELFGQSIGEGSPTVTQDKPGLIESAHLGTLFLDEIGDMPLAIQAKLSRFLQDKRFQRPGESRSRAIDVRVIAATHMVTLSGGTDETVLKPDLYYRLSEFEIKLPPLRNRGRDALLIAANILEKNRQRLDQPKLRMSSRAEKAVLSYGWPGNVRELENRLNRAAIACRSQIIEEDDLQLGDAINGNMSYREARKAFEKNLLQNALHRANGNVSLAARTVGVTRPTFYDMMRKTGIHIRSDAKT